MPSDFALKTMNFVHKTILTVSGGKKGWNAGNMPVLKLTTTGRTSGQPRECMLTSPIQQGDTYVVVASRGGDDHHRVAGDLVPLADDAATITADRWNRIARRAIEGMRGTIHAANAGDGAVFSIELPVFQQETDS